MGSALHRVSVPLVALLLQQLQQWWPLLQLCLLAAVVVVEDVDAVVDAALAPLAHSQLLCAPLAHSHHVCAPLARSQLLCAALVQHQLAEDVDAADRNLVSGYHMDPVICDFRGFPFMKT